MAIEKISAEDILGYKNRSTNEIKLMTANSYLSRLVFGFEDELLPFLNSPKRFISLDESTVGEVTTVKPLKRVNLANSELGDTKVAQTDDEKHNGRLDLYQKEIKEDYDVRQEASTITDKVSGETQSTNLEGENNADTLANEYNNYYSEPTYIIDEDEMKNPDAVDEEVSLTDYLKFGNDKHLERNTDEYADEYTEDTESLQEDYAKIYEDENEHNYDDEQNCQALGSNTESEDETGEQSSLYSSNKIQNFSGKQGFKDFGTAGVGDDFSYDYKDDNEYMVSNYKDLNNNNKSASQISIKRQVYDISNLGELDKNRWSKLNEVTKKTLNKFNSLPSFAEFKKVREAYDENDINDIVLDYQKLLVKYLNGGGEVLTESIETLKEELKNMSKNN